MSVEFTCAECGRDLVLLTDDEAPLAGLCVACVLQPGWYRHEDLRSVLAADHDGRELVERIHPHLAEARP